MARAILNEQLLQQCKHRYRSLEVELNDAARNGAIQSVDYARRLSALQRLGQQITSLEVVSATTKITASHPEIIDLPLLGECSRAEQKVILSALSESKKLIDQLTLDTEKLMTYASAATSESGNWIKIAFRLSWLRTRMSWTERQLISTRSLRDVLESFIRKVAPNKPGLHPKVDLVEAFREFETTTSRVANLRTRLRSELAKNFDQEKWLDRYEDSRRQSSTPIPPPAPAEIEAVKQGISGDVLKRAKDARERLVIAGKLADSLTTERNSTAIAQQKLTVPTPKPKTKANGKGARK